MKANTDSRSVWEKGGVSKDRMLKESAIGGAYKRYYSLLLLAVVLLLWDDRKRQVMHNSSFDCWRCWTGSRSGNDVAAAVTIAVAGLWLSQGGSCCIVDTVESIKLSRGQDNSGGWFILVNKLTMVSVHFCMHLTELPDLMSDGTIHV